MGNSIIKDKCDNCMVGFWEDTGRQEVVHVKELAEYIYKRTKYIDYCAREKLYCPYKRRRPLQYISRTINESCFFRFEYCPICGEPIYISKLKYDLTQEFKKKCDPGFMNEVEVIDEWKQ